MILASLGAGNNNKVEPLQWRKVRVRLISYRAKKFSGRHGCLLYTNNSIATNKAFGIRSKKWAGKQVYMSLVKESDVGKFIISGLVYLSDSVLNYETLTR